MLGVRVCPQHGPVAYYKGSKKWQTLMLGVCVCPQHWPIAYYKGSKNWQTLMLGVRVCPLHGPGARAAGGRAAEPAATASGRLPQPRRQEPCRGGGGQGRPQPQDSRSLRGQLFLFSRAQGM